MTIKGSNSRGLILAMSVSLIFSAYLYWMRSLPDQNGRKEDIIYYSDNGDPFGFNIRKRWKVIVFKNYECPACRIRNSEFVEFEKSHKQYIEFRFANFTFPTMKLSLPAALVAEQSRVLGEFETVDHILLADRFLANSALQKAVSIFQTRLTQGVKVKAQTRISEDTIAGVKLGVKAIPAIFAISPAGGVYQVTHMGALNALINNEQSFRPRALRSIQ